MDWISLVERAYDLRCTDQEWLSNVLRAAAPALDSHSAGVLGHVLCLKGRGPEVERVAVVGGPPGLADFIHRTTSAAPPEAAQAMFAGAARAMSGYLLLASVSEWQAKNFERLCLEGSGGAFRDCHGVVAHDGEGNTLTIGAGQPEITEMKNKSRWNKIATHLGAGWRVRKRLQSLDLEDRNVEGVFDVDGSAQHLSKQASTESAREQLGRAIKAIDRARGTLRAADADESLRLWSGLIHGRWSLLDHVDTDGRRFVVARRNDPRAPDPRGLTERELFVAESVGRGLSIKEIAYELGLSESLVARAAATVRKKLGVASLPELALFFAPAGVRTRLRAATIAGEELALGEYGIDEQKLEELSEAEREVALSLLRGDTNQAIAAERATSERTVANQIASVYKKFGVTSRVELAASLATS